MGRGIIHRKVQTNRARELEAPDHQRAGIGSMALSSLHRDNPDLVRDMLAASVPPTPEPMVMLRRDDLDDLLNRLARLESAVLPSPSDSAHPAAPADTGSN